MKTPKEVSQLKLAAQVSRHVQIEEVRLVQMSGRLFPRPPGLDGGMALLHQKQKTSVRRAVADLVIEIRFGLRGVGKDDVSSKLFELSAAFELTYKLDKKTDFPAAQLRAFSSVNGLYNAWPYWREFVQNTAARMGLPRLVVPVFRVPRAPRAEKVTQQAVKKNPQPGTPAESAAPAKSSSST
jgi:hypothetical protein